MFSQIIFVQKLTHVFFCQLSVYSEKFDEFQGTVSKSHNVYASFKQDMDKVCVYEIINIFFKFLIPSSYTPDKWFIEALAHAFQKCGQTCQNLFRVSHKMHQCLVCLSVPEQNIGFISSMFNQGYYWWLRLTLLQIFC